MDLDTLTYTQARNAERLAEYERRKVLTPFERRAIREQQRRERREQTLAMRVVRRIMNWRKS